MPATRVSTIDRVLVEIDEPFAQPPRLPRRQASPPPTQQVAFTGEDGLLEITSRNLDGAIIDLDGVEQLDIERCELRRVSFENFDDNTEIRIAQSSIEHTDMSRLRIRTIRQSRVADAKLVGTDFSDGLVQDCEFTHCVLRLANFRMASLKRVAMEDCQLIETDAYRASLEHVSFELSQLAELNLDGAEANRVDLRGASGLELKGINRLDGYLITESQLPAIAYQLANIVGLSIER